MQNTKSPKILVACPTYEGMSYCHDEFFTRILNFTHNQYDILIIDNSIKDTYYNKLKNIPHITVIRDNSKENDKMIRLINSRNKTLEYASINNYDFILMLDADVIPPKNIISALLAAKKDIISAIYFNYFTTSNILKYLPVVWMPISKEEFTSIQEKVNLPDSVTSHLDLRRHLTIKEIKDNSVLEVLFPSAGCVLLSKNVFTILKYGLLDTKKWGNIKTTDDIYFMTKARDLGFIPHIDTRLRCKHLIIGKYHRNNNEYTHPIYD